jgi:L-iditol 2-dehydrogenase
MKVARFYAPGDVRVEQADEPQPGPQEVKLRVRNCSTCGTDVKIFRAGHPNLDPPRIIGHEIAGEIVEVGSQVEGWSVGDRVQVIAAVPCGACRECLRGRMTVCLHQTSVGYQYEGGFAEYLVVPEQVMRVDGLNRIPEGIGFAEASVAEPLACVVNGQRMARIGSGDDVVVVIGAGPIGCLHVRLARAHGAQRVVLADLQPDRLKLSADRVEPDAVIDASTMDLVEEVMRLSDGNGADVVITAAASGAAQEQALRMAARGGRISFFGGLPKDKPVIACDSNLVHYRELTIVGANGSSPSDNKQALELIASGAVPVADLITHRLGLDDVLQALDIVARGVAVKVTIEP